MQYLNDIIDLIDASIEDTLHTSGTHIIKRGYDSEADRLAWLLENGHQWISNYQESLVTQTGIQRLKIKFTNNAGYFIEIPSTNIEDIPDTFVFKQRLTQVYRYTTTELSEFQEDTLSAEIKLEEREKSIFLNICNNINNHFDKIYWLSRNMSLLDFYANAAHISWKNSYITPEISSHYSLDIKEGRHPVLERLEWEFISNDLSLSKRDTVHIITGPNMWGKSTYLRQNALLILMSHMWLNIPAKNAIIPQVDGVFSRVWAGDNLFLGQSTFMVEMQEIAYILNHATQRSFVIIDEIGRGTSTYDGMSLAWSILKYIHDTLKAKTLFATHYHEITDHASELTKVSNYSVAVSENSENIVFLRKIIPWAVKKSYGIEVARLSGLPSSVLDMAKETLQSYSVEQMSLNVDEKQPEEISQKTAQLQEFLSWVQEKDLNTMTPIEALSYLLDLQKQLENMK